MLRRFLVAGTFSFVGIQFVPVDQSNPPTESEIPASPEVRVILRNACYDCHSNETTWPWYSKVAPVSWLVTSDVHEGRDELNFSSWGRYDTEQQIKKLKESWEEIEEGEMPPWSFILMHKEAVISPAERELLRKWVVELTTKK